MSFWKNLFNGDSKPARDTMSPSLPETATLPNGTLVSTGELIKQLESENEKTFQEGLNLVNSMTDEGNKLGVSTLREAIRIKSRRRDVSFFEPEVPYPIASGPGLTAEDITTSANALREMIALRGKVESVAKGSNRYMQVLAEVVALATKKRLLSDVKRSSQLLASLPFMADDNKRMALKCLIQAVDVLAGGGHSQGFAFLLIDAEMRCSSRLAHPPEEGKLAGITPLQVQPECGQVSSDELLAAAVAGKADQIKLLLDAGVDKNATDKDGMTALHTAAVLGDVPVVTMLLAHGANTEAKEVQGGLTALHLAAFGGHSAVVSKLLVAAAKVDARSADGRTPLYFAAAKGHVETASLLLANHADKDAKTADGATLLQTAAAAGHGFIIELLLAAGVDTEAKDDKGWTALHHGVTCGDVKVVSLLLAAKADITAREGSYNSTALHLAAGMGHVPIVEMLLAAGADELAMAQGKTPLDVARANGRSEVLKILETAQTAKST
jgi:ankyrin repeat protein